MSHKILLVEDYELVRQGLVFALKEQGYILVGEAENGQEAVDKTDSLSPEIILMDIGMPIKDGITATQEIKQKHPDIKIIMLTSHQTPDEVYASLSAGADAYCMKDIKMDRLCQVIEMVIEGALWLDPAIARLIQKALPKAGTSTLSQEGQPEEIDNTKQKRIRYNAELTDREHEVLQLIVDGKSNKQIASELNFTIHTAKAHVANIIQKLAVDDRTQVAVKALKEGML